MSERAISSSVEYFARAVRSVCEEWGLTAQRWFEGGAGTPTLAVTGADAVEGVLKIAEPGDLDVAAAVMESANGRGYARVLAWDADRGALLTELLGGTLWAEATTLDQQGPVIVSLLLDAWRVPLDRGARVDGKAAGLLSILADLGPRYGTDHPRAIAQAVRHARTLAATERPEVVCHGDPHPGNVLRRGSSWVLIDPDGFVGERSYDLGVVLRDACGEIRAAELSESGSGAVLLRRQCDRLAQLTDSDPERVWRWAFVERVTTGLYLRWFGYVDESTMFLDTAEMLTRSLAGMCLGCRVPSVDVRYRDALVLGVGNSGAGTHSLRAPAPLTERRHHASSTVPRQRTSDPSRARVVDSQQCDRHGCDIAQHPLHLGGLLGCRWWGQPLLDRQPQLAAHRHSSDR